MPHQFNILKRSFFLPAAILAAALLSAAAQAQPQMPPPTVGVLTLQERSVPVISELPGRIAATRTAEVRARVTGILLERVFQQGTRVEQGDVLYRIDPKLFQVRVASAEAALQKARAAQLNAQQQFDRRKALKERNYASEVDFDAAVAALAQAKADVAGASAALDEAKINLDYTEVRAPISGIIGGALVTEGALVTADGTQNLALIQQIDPAYADFTQSSSQLLGLKRAVEQGKLASPAPGQARVELVFDDGSIYPLPGRLLFASASVDATTGQVTLRAEFPNPKGDVLPGMYVRVRIEQAVQQDALVIPQRAVIRAPSGAAQVYVLAEGDVGALRDIVLGKAIGNEWVVQSGLKTGDRVIVDGVQKVQPGGKVVPEPWTPEKNPADSPAHDPQVQ